MGTLTQLNTALAGRYSVEREIGAGGMAVVYLARDLRHDRRVALKVLNPELGAVLGIERFLAEIRVTANLQHPNLLPLFDSGEADGLLFYVMPFVEGQALRAKLLTEKQLPIQEAVHIAVAVAGALDYAHSHGVIHRDLKPENILLQHGEPVVADFGIALAISRAGGQRVTQTGISLGTPHYMSPEQATGDRQIDGRTDLYSLGAVLYEMLAGEPPHTGNTAQAVIARLLTDKPRSVRTVRNTVPAHVEAALDRCLAKLPADRFHTAGEFARALTSGSDVAIPSGVMTPASVSRDVRVSFTIPMERIRGVAPWLGVATLAAVGAWGWLRPKATQDLTMRFRLELPFKQRIVESAIGNVFGIAPNGKTIVYLAADTMGLTQLWVRSSDQLVPRALDRTNNARIPVFSPDGQWIAFATGSEVRKVPVDGGPSITLGPIAGSTTGLSWGVPDKIIIGGPVLTAVPAVGGLLDTIAKPDLAKKIIALRWPLALPDGKTVVYTKFPSAGMAAATLGALHLDDRKPVALGLQGTYPMGFLDGLLFYGTTNGAIMAAPFDPARLRVTGNPIPVAQDVLMDGPGSVKGALSRTGDLVYYSGVALASPVLVDERGARRSVTDDLRAYSTPRFSPDGRKIAVAIIQGQGSDVWIYDIAKATLTRLTTEGVNSRPEWSPDGKRILFRSERTAGLGIYWQPFDGSGPAEPLLRNDVDPFEAILSPDGKRLIYRTSPGVEFSRDIFYFDLPDASHPKPLVVGPMADQMPRVSPDGKWLAYQSDESGQPEIYVRPFPVAGGKIQVSATGGTEPLWSRDGHTLFYRSAQRVIAARVSTSPTFSLGARRVLFSDEFVPNASHANWDVAPDGKHFLMIKRAGGEAQTIVVHNWIAEVLRRVNQQR